MCASVANGSNVSGGLAEQETAQVGKPDSPIQSVVNALPCLVQIYPADGAIGRRYVLDQSYTFGREADCDIRLEESSVSRHHCRIVLKPDGCFVADIRSTNGTFVNDNRVIVHRLADGDYVRVGSHIYRYLAGGNIEADYHEEIFRLMMTDALTGIANKRHLLDFLERELSRSNRHLRPLALLLLDVDHFKAVNDSHGHLAGDAVLRELADRMRGDIRREECLARYGGEELAVVLPETTRDGAGRMAERLRQLVADRPFGYNGDSLTVTVSVGVTATEGGERLSPAQFLARADAKLYQAKEQGRNRVVL